MTNSAWCPMCKQVSTVTTVTIDREMLAQLRFRCKCGLERTLHDLRTHILEEGLHEQAAKAVQPDFTSLLMTNHSDLELRVRTIAAEELRKLKHEIDGSDKADDEKHGILQRIEADKTELLQKTEEDKRELLQVIQKSQAQRGHSRPAMSIEQLYDSVSILRDEVDNLKHCRQATAQKAFFWFEFEELNKRFQVTHDSVKSELQHTFIGGIPFQACIKLWAVDKKEYLDICGGRADHTEIEVPLPLNRKLIRNTFAVRTHAEAMLGNRLAFQGILKDILQGILPELVVCYNRYFASVTTGLGIPSSRPVRIYHWLQI
ncbi:hypothetical protein BIW11_12052 [Tropilaelaps mercedesae]|uniref:Uncharacterized protein n=1 Tax=Tropilaelaps mercedesae TaxID=418985 RepID=A0A1V9X8T0_9ACAR|nr:hypothetical protein BIW11_12052 [Tropilaelaps mercedesae]